MSLVITIEYGFTYGAEDDMRNKSSNIREKTGHMQVQK
jgi:hypothetical protein